MKKFPSATLSLGKEILKFKKKKKLRSISVTNIIYDTGKRGRDSGMAGVGPCSSLSSPYRRIQRLEQVPFLPYYLDTGAKPPVYAIAFSYSYPNQTRPADL